MMVNKELTHSFVFSPPDEEPQTWDTAHIQDFPRRLEESFPGATATSGEAWDRNPNRVTWSFEAPLGDAWLEGVVTVPQPGAGSFSVDHATPHEAAVLLEWFQQHYVPASAAVVFTTGLGLDNGVDEVRHVPAAIDREELIHVLAEHAENIESSLGS